MKREHAVLGIESIILILASQKKKKAAKCLRQLLFIIWMVLAISSFKYNWITTVLLYERKIETIPDLENIPIERQITQ